MARTNKYASLNFNDIYEKKKIANPNNNSNNQSSGSSSSSSPSFTNHSKTTISNSRIHGSMLVLSRPSPKPILQPPQQQQQSESTVPDQAMFDQDSISLRPLGRTGAGLSLSSSPLTSPRPDREVSVSPKTNRFVPPHLRPGFVGREERIQPENHKQLSVRSREFGGQRQGNFGSPSQYDEEARPRSGGGYERMRKVGDSDLIEMNRPGSSGSRPSSSG